MPPAKVRAAFQLTKIISYNSLGGNLWAQLFEIHRVTETVRQNSDPEFAQTESEKVIMQMMMLQKPNFWQMAL